MSIILITRSTHLDQIDITINPVTKETKISYQTYKTWAVKEPTSDHRLSRKATCSFSIGQWYELIHNKKGILFVDHSLKCFVTIPKELITEDLFAKQTFLGVKDSLVVFQVKPLLEKGLVSKTPFRDLSKVLKEDSNKSKVAQTILKGFGL